MTLLLKNSKGIVEICIEENGERSVDEIGFSIEVRHHPFMANLNVAYSTAELERFSQALGAMALFQLFKYTFVSIEREVTISFVLEQTGHITASVIVYAGSHGSLHYSFDFDQSFIPEIIEQIKQLSE